MYFFSQDKSTVGISNPTYQNLETFEIRAFRRLDSKWSGYQRVHSFSPHHLKTGHFCLDFKWFFTKRLPIDQIANGWAARFQITFKIQDLETNLFMNIWNPDKSGFQTPLNRMNRLASSWADPLNIWGQSLKYFKNLEHCKKILAWRKVIVKRM